jgi:NitT/TauT family transport system substrate-binding protein
MKHLITVAAAALLLQASAMVPALAEPFRLIVTHLEAPLVPNSVLDLALQEGYFERAGVEVELVRVQQTPSALAAIQSGEGEMANVGTDSLIQLVAQGIELKAVSSPNKSLPFLIASKDTIAEVKDLAGKTFGVGRVGSLDHNQSTKVLELAGVDPASLEIVSVGQPAARAQSLLVGAIDATTMSIGAYTSLPEKDGIHILVDPDTYYEAAPVVSKVNIVPAEVLENRRDEVVAVTEALIQISRDFATDPALWVAAMEKARPDIAKADLEALADAYKASWSINGGLQRNELEFTSQWYYGSEDFVDVPELAIDDWADFSVVDAILEKIGEADGMDTVSR